MAQLGLDEAEPVGGLPLATPRDHNIVAEFLGGKGGDIWNNYWVIFFSKFKKIDFYLKIKEEIE